MDVFKTTVILNTHPQKFAGCLQSLSPELQILNPTGKVFFCLDNGFYSLSRLYEP